MLVCGMARKADEALAVTLGAKPPAGLRVVSAADLTHLTEAIELAFEHQQQAMADAEDQALGHVPWPLRRTVRKILGSDR